VKLEEEREEWNFGSGWGGCCRGGGVEFRRVGEGGEECGSFSLRFSRDCLGL